MLAQINQYIEFPSVAFLWMPGVVSILTCQVPLVARDEKLAHAVRKQETINIEI